MAVVPINVRLVAAFALAAGGLAIGFVTAGDGSEGFGVSSNAPITAAPANAGRPLADRLAEIRQALAFRPDQDPAWRRYADVLLQLDRSRRDLERRVASGKAQDDGTERILHALALGAAIEDLAKSLSPEQVARARLLTDDLASAVICKGLAGS